MKERPIGTVFVAGILAAITAHGLHAQARGSLDSLLHVAIQPATEPTAGPGDMELALRNTSGKDVVAYGLDITTIWPDGSSTSSGTLRTDFVLTLPPAARDVPTPASKYQHYGPLRPGEEMFQPLGGPPLDAENAKRIVTVKAIIFGDNTSAGDRTQIENFFSSHADAGS
jgi:hypothetical protein